MASAVNDWLSAEWLAHELRLRAALVMPSQQPEMAAREIERLGGTPTRLDLTGLFQTWHTRGLIPFAPCYSLLHSGLPQV